MDKGKMTTGQKLIRVGGFLLFVNLFIPWYRGGGFASIGIGVDAFEAGFLAWFGSICAIGAAGIIALKMAGKGGVGGWQLKAEYVALVLGAAGFVLILVRLITESNSVFIGIILGLIASAGLTFGVLLEAGFTLPSGGRDNAPPPPPPPPPA